ncbi:MAG TPA: LD-carboxypeptidase [Longimicrobiales bacterium]|nr:LD-carboxypeptidase [Longimicrobiales bacterium]
MTGSDRPARWLRPPRLAPGARVALVAPAGPVDDARIARAVARLQRLGLEPVEGRGVRERAAYLAGSDRTRAADIAWAFRDPGIDAVWALRGGYGSMRLWRQLPLEILRTRPRVFLGYSDNTSLHLAFQRQGVVSFHGPHAGAERLPSRAAACLVAVLFEAAPAGVLPGADARPVPLVGGRAEGRLAGGNLSLLAAAAGTPFAPEARGRILILEDVDEAVYRIDRMLEQLLASGVMEGVRGLALGRFTKVADNRRPRKLDDVLAEFAGRLGVPTLSNLPFGHLADSWTLPLGARARLDADAGTLEILEPAVR